MNAHGMNTADSTRPMATTGPDTCSIALHGRLARRQAVLDVVLDRLDDDDGVIDDDADGQHQAEQRQVVQAEADRRHDGEGADDGHRHGDQRDQRRAPVLQEHQHHDGHQDDGVEQRLEDLVDRLVDERRGVVDDGVVDARREVALAAPSSGP